MKLKMGNLSRFSPTAVLSAFWAFLAASLRSRVGLQIEILALRHQLNVLQRSVKRPLIAVKYFFFWGRLFFPSRFVVAGQAARARLRFLAESV
jgi:hypothetical protein